MARQRKTVDFYELHVRYAGGWEHEVTEFHWEEMRKRLKEYRENVPEWPAKCIKRRVLRSTLDADELAKIEEAIKEGEARRKARFRARLSRTFNGFGCLSEVK